MSKNFKEEDLEGKAKKIHQPEFILLDKEEEPSTFSSNKAQRDYQRQEQQDSQKSDYTETLKKLSHKRLTFPVHMLILLAAITLAIATAITATLAILSFILAGLILFQSVQLNHFALYFWQRAYKLFIFTLGLSFAVFTPSFGFGLILLYLSLKGEKVKNTYFSRFFNL